MAKIDIEDYLEKLDEPEDREAMANREYQRQIFEQYVTSGDNFPERRAQLLRDYKTGKELTGPKGLRRKLGAIDLEYFGRAYLAHYFVRKSPAFHGELDRIWREGVMKGLDPTESAKEINRADGCRRAIEAPVVMPRVRPLPLRTIFTPQYTPISITFSFSPIAPNRPRASSQI